jgi:hypothetical protein
MTLKRIRDLDEAWRTTGNGPQLRAIKRAAEGLRERFAGGPRCVSVRTLPLSTLAYPTRYAFGAAAFAPPPLVSLTHRATLVQFFEQGELKNLVFNPTDIDGARATPFFTHMIEQFGDRVIDLVAKRFAPLEEQLRALGVEPRAIDYVAFDHFHTQDLSKLSTRFPNATLLAPKKEWDDWDDVHPFQRAWFVRDGKSNIAADRVLLTENDLELGEGVMLLRTPGHTSGNQTLFMNTSSGVWGISENGTCADNWSPLASKIKGLAYTCKKQDLDIILNSNTPEFGATQYTSMVLERTIVDRLHRAPAFVQMFSSSEVTPSVLAPGLSPTVLHESISHGDVVRPAKAA